MRFVIAAVCLGACVTPSALANDSSSWPALFREAALPKADDAGVAFDVEILTQSANDEDESGEQRIAYSVTAPIGSRRLIDLTELPDDMDRDEFIEDVEDPDSDIWCDDYKDVVGGEVVLREETDSTAIYAFPVNPDAADDKQERKIMKKVEVTVEVDKAEKRILNFAYRLTEPVKPMVVAKVRTFELIGQCAAGIGARPHVASIMTKVAGSALGQSFDSITHQTISNVRLLD